MTTRSPRTDAVAAPVVAAGAVDALVELDGPDDVDVYELPTGGDNDVIDIEPDRATRQTAWVTTYQQALAAAGGDPRRVGEDGRVALDALVRDVIPLVQSIATSEVGKRFGDGRPGTVVEDCHAAGMIKVIELAATFDERRCPAFHMAVSAKRGDVRAAMRDVVDASNGVGPLPKEHRRVARRARGIRSEQLRKLGREVTLAELQELTLAYYREQQRDKVSGLPKKEADKAIEARLTHSGIKAAVADLGLLLTVTEAQRTPDGEENGWAFVADELGEAGGLARPDDRVNAAADAAELTSFERVATGNLTPLERAAVVARLLGSDGPDAPEGPWTFTAISERYRIPTRRTRELVDTARVRLTAPHAQFAHLAPGLEAQFETAPAPASSSVAALSRRLGRAVPLTG